MKSFLKFLSDFIFPKFCFGCNKEGTFLCQDCFSLIEIYKEHIKFKNKFLDDLYSAGSYNNFILKKLILAFKYEPFVKELAKELAKILISHFEILDEKPNFSNFVLVPVPLDKKRLKWRGFNQSEEIAKEIGKTLSLPLFSDCLIKIKSTFPQVELDEKQRRKNLKGVFYLKRELKGEKILLVDDVFTTGTTLEECAKVLKKGGAEKVIGITVAIAKPGEDKL